MRDFLNKNQPVLAGLEQGIRSGPQHAHAAAVKVVGTAGFLQALVQMGLAMTIRDVRYTSCVVLSCCVVCVQGLCSIVCSVVPRPAGSYI